MFFSKQGEYQPCGMFSLTHMIVLVFCIVVIAIGVYCSRTMKEKTIRRLTRIIAICVSILESGKILFAHLQGNTNLDSWVPLYFCSMFIYACILSGYTKGVFQALGDAFIGTGGIVAGAMFLLMPSTSLTTYPMFHFLSCYSMLYHSLMVYLGIVYISHHFIVLEKKTLMHYMLFCTFFSIIAIILNLIYHSNFMFLREPYNIPLPFLKPFSEKLPICYTILMYLSCTLGTYFILYMVLQLISSIQFKIRKKEKNNGEDYSNQYVPH